MRVIEAQDEEGYNAILISTIVDEEYRTEGRLRL